VSEGQIGLCRPTPDEISAGFARRVRDYGAWSGLLVRGEFVFGPLAATQEAWLVDPVYEPYLGLYYCWFHGCLAAVDCDCDALRASSCVDGCKAPGLAVESPWDRLPTELEGHAVTVVGRYVEVRIPEISAGPFVDPRYVCPR